MLVNPNSVKTIVLDSTRASSNASGLRQFNFPSSKLPFEGYYKVTSIFVKGTLPTSAYLQVISPELGSINQTICDNNTTDWTSNTITLTPNQASYVENRLGVHLYSGMYNNIITIGITDDANNLITNDFMITIDFRPRI